MSEKPRNYEEDLASIMNALAESVLEMSDEEILAEAREEGEDPEEVAERVKNVLLEAVKAYEQRHLRTDQEQYKRRVAAMGDKRCEMPTTPNEKRKLLAAFFARNLAMKSVLLTVQHRKFEDLTDADVESHLRQLKELGALDDFLNSGAEEK
jgi:hypothetical protein